MNVEVRPAIPLLAISDQSGEHGWSIAKTSAGSPIATSAPQSRELCEPGRLYWLYEASRLGELDPTNQLDRYEPPVTRGDR